MKIVIIIIFSIIILLFAVISYSTWKFRNGYDLDVEQGIARTKEIKEKIITREDLEHLPELVKNYLNYVGVVGKPKVVNMRVSFKAHMRGKNQDWFALKAEQNNFFDEYERLFFLNARVKGLPTRGYHRYKDGESSMQIKLFYIIPVVDVKGEEMFTAETVTFFNDMSFLAPATLIDKRIKWEHIDSTSVKATFSNRGSTISAILYYNEKGQLVNFVSDDRYDVNEMKKYRFSTPISNYRKINGYHLATYGEAIWHYPDGKYTYGKYELLDIRYNVEN